MSLLRFNISADRDWELQLMIEGYSGISTSSMQAVDSDMVTYMLSGDDYSINEIQTELFLWGNKDCLFLSSKSP